MTNRQQRSWRWVAFVPFVLVSALSLVAVALSWSGASAGSIEGAALRAGTVTVVTYSKIRSFSSDVDRSRSFDLDGTRHPFETYQGEHAPRVYHARWEGWTPRGWRPYSATFEVNGATIIVPLWRADGAARIVYMLDHISERRYWK
ncbi:MAG: hypothetical protein ACE5I7_10035 [Candidatus Binatia bacterium]